MTTIRSVHLECRSYNDTNGNTNTGAALWINGVFIGHFGLQYGAPSVLEYYTLEAYLQSVGILPETEKGTYTPYVGRRLNELGVDYYCSEFRGLKRECPRETTVPNRHDLWAYLSRAEQRRHEMVTS